MPRPYAPKNPERFDQGLATRRAVRNRPELNRRDRSLLNLAMITALRPAA